MTEIFCDRIFYDFKDSQNFAKHSLENKLLFTVVVMANMGPDGEEDNSVRSIARSRVAWAILLIGKGFGIY